MKPSQGILEKAVFSDPSAVGSIANISHSAWRQHVQPTGSLLNPTGLLLCLPKADTPGTLDQRLRLSRMEGCLVWS